MAADPIASRYAQALFEAAQVGGEIDATQQQLALIGALMRAEPALCELLFNPGVAAEQKVLVLDRVLGGEWSETVRAFVQMVIALGRAESLPPIVEAFAVLVDAAQGRLRVTVRSAHPLSEAALSRIRKTLERQEAQQIELTAELAPELLGGVQLQLDHRVIDGSVQRQLAELGERLAAVRVN